MYWFDHDRESKNIEGRKEKMDKLYKKLGSTIINNTINLYDDEYYSPKNIWGLYRLYREDDAKIKEYIKKVVNERNIFRFLFDIIGLSSGTQYRYYISEEYLNSFTTEADIDEILKTSKPISEDQEFVFNVYKKYKEGTTEHWGEKGIVTNEIRYLKP